MNPFKSALFAIALVATGASSASAATVTSSGSLSPAFSRTLPNYTTTCVGSSIRLGVSALPATSVQIGTTPAKKGSRTQTVRLSPNKRVVVKVTEGGTTTSHSIRCLPTDFPKLSARGELPPSIRMFAMDDISDRAVSAGKVYAYTIIVDRHGVPIWWKRVGSSVVNFFAAPDGKLAFGNAGGALEFYDLRGTKTSQIRPASGDTDAHEALPTSRGTWYMGLHGRRSGVDLRPIGLNSSESVYDSAIFETTTSGQTLWSWDSVTHLNVNEVLIPQITRTPTGRIVDIAHVNSFEEDGQGGLITSFREPSAVYRIRLSDGSIDWKLGGTTTPQSLTVLGDTDIGLQRHLMGQHDARLQPDGTISIFDNGSAVTENGVRTTRPARVLRVAIDPLARTATVVETLKDPEIGSSPCCGSARKMTDGSWLVAWGGTPHIRAYDSSGNPTFWLEYRSPDRFTYRATPILTPRITEAAVVSGMDYVK